MKTVERIISIIELAAYAAAVIVTVCAVGVLMRGGWL